EPGPHPPTPDQRRIIPCCAASGERARAVCRERTSSLDYLLFAITFTDAGLRSASEDFSPGPIRSSRELTLAGTVVPITRRPPTFVATQGITHFDGFRGSASCSFAHDPIRYARHRQAGDARADAGRSRGALSGSGG